jgi:hypothetical protein
MEAAGHTKEKRFLIKNSRYLIVLCIFLGQAYYSNKIQKLEQLNARLELQRDSVILRENQIEKYLYINSKTNKQNNGSQLIHTNPIPISQSN